MSRERRTAMNLPRAIMFLDTETRSPRDLPKCGPYRYSEPPDPGDEDEFELLLLCYLWRDHDGDTAVEWSPLEGPPPAGCVEALTDPTVLKVAHNANFDRVILSRLVHPGTVDEFLDPDQWYDTLAAAAEVALPGHLDDLAHAVGVPGKIDEGKDLIRFFNRRPIRDRLVDALTIGRGEVRAGRAACYENGRLIRGMRAERDGWDRMLDVLDRWDRYKGYCAQDVRALADVCDRLPYMQQAEIDLWHADQRINDRGVRIDMDLVDAATRRRDELSAEAYDALKELTGLDNPNSGRQLTRWLWDRGLRTDSSPASEAAWDGRSNWVGLNTKDDVPELRKQARERGDEDVLRAFELRDVVAARATKKLDAIRDRVSADGRVRGCFRFYGAGHTGRFSSKGLQLQNLPRISGDEYDLIAAACDDPARVASLDPSQLKQTLRGILVADDVFSVADFSAIEARVTAWLAGQEDELDAFRAGRDIYLSTWAAMTGTDYDSYSHDSPERPLGKATTLGCGFGGGVTGINRVGGDRIHPTEDFERQWREDEWVRFDTGWRFVYEERRLPTRPQPLHHVALACMGAGVPKALGAVIFDRWCAAPAQRVRLHDAYIDHLKVLWRKAHPMIVQFWRDLEDAFRSAAFQGLESWVGAHILVRSPRRGTAVVRLPSGRELWYRGVHVEKRWDPERERMKQELTYRDSRGALEHTHGGKLTENVVQATARDLMRTALLALDAQGAEVVAHIHDEIVCEGRPDIVAAMVRQPEWAEGLPLAADPAESIRYLGH